jgi:hypothetical protein
MSKTMVLNLDDFVASTCTDTTRTVGTGGMSVVNSSNGKRVSLNAAILNELSHQNSVQISYTDDFVAIANYIGESNTDYSISKNGKNGVIYNTALVSELVEHFHLDYSNRTSITFPIMDVQENENGNVVFINMKSLQD